MVAAGPAKTKEVAAVVKSDQAVPGDIGRSAQLFHHQFALDRPDGQGLVTSRYQVPADKRLMIKYASLSAYLTPSGQSMFVRIVTTTDDDYATTDASHTLTLQNREDYGVLKQFGEAHVVRIYADPNTSVRVSLARTPSSDIASDSVTLSGRLEDVPS